MTRFLASLLTLLVVSALPTAGTAEPSASEILKAVDGVATLCADFTAHIALQTIDDGEETTRTLTVWQKGDTHRMVKILSPARLRGVGLLAQETEEKYHLYLPAFKKVRRIAGVDRGNSFFGSHFSQDDMARTRYRDRYRPTLLEQSETMWTLRLDPKAPDEEPHHHVIIQVRREDSLIASLEYFDEEGGKAVRRLEGKDFRKAGTLPMAFTIEARDLVTGGTSTATFSEVATDTGLETRFFSTRQLERSP